MRCQKSSNLRDNRAIKTANHNLVSLAENAVGKNDIDGRSQALDDLDFKHRTFELRKIHEAVAHALLGQIDEQHDHVRDTFTGDSRRRDNGHIARKVLVVVVQHGVETFLSEGEDDLGNAVFKLALDSPRLFRQ